ncbi:hypothetical protein K1719_017423 [Acacia pycnantha]|nr:hypothetical protein K1719_017423 [Acacia pycnantha]
MDFEDQEEQEEEIGMESLGISPRVKMPMTSAGGAGEAMVLPQPTRTYYNSNNNSKGRYRECLKNHAVGLGGHALDGCGEFMPAGAEGTLDALKCAACNCHRNFHRKETEPFLLTPHYHHHQQPPQFAAAYYRAPAGYLHVAGQHRGGQGTLALPSTSGGGGGTQSTRDEQDDDVSNPSGGGGGGSSSAKKRFRTKFTQEQKDKMLELAERLGWRIQKQDEELVQQFCNEMGVKRQVLKVWMHNNKHTVGKKP